MELSQSSYKQIRQSLSSYPSTAFDDGSILINADAFNAMKSLPDSSIDCIITDPPYFIDGMGSDWNPEHLNHSRSKAGVIGSMPVGMKFDKEQGKHLQAFMQNISEEAYRVLKPGGFYLSFSQGRLYHRMAVGMEDAGFEIRDMIVWHRNGQGKAFTQTHFVRKMNIPDDEKARIITSLDGRKTPQLKGDSEPIALAQKPREGTFVENWMKYGVGLIDYTQSLGTGHVPSTVMEVPKPGKEEREGSSHLTIKPLALMDHLIRIFTKEGDIILDPFSGSGTTVASAVRTGRIGIGIEIDKTYYTESIEKIRKTETR